MTNIRKLIKNSQVMLLLLFLLTWIVFGVINPSIFSMANIYSLVRASLTPALYSLAIMLIIIQGGFDMSFATVGAFGSYCTILILTSNGQMDVPIYVPFLMSIVICVALEMLNCFLIDKLNLQPFITTLGTQSIIKGALLAFISTSYIYTLPDSLHDFGTTYIAQAFYDDGTGTILPMAAIIVVVLYIATHLLLQYTSYGRQVYAIGADVEAARRAGISVSKVRFATFALAGVFCGIAGLVHDCIARSSVPNPTDVVGQELTFIAAVVLGCGTTKQARGSVVGTLVGVLFLRFIMTNLILLGVSSYWQKFVIGVIVLIGLMAQMSKGRRMNVQ